MSSVLDAKVDAPHQNTIWGVVEVMRIFCLMGQWVYGVGNGGYYQRVLPLVFMVNVVNHWGIKRTEPGIHEITDKDIFLSAGFITSLSRS